MICTVNQLLDFSMIAVDTGRKLNIHKTFNLRPVSTEIATVVSIWNVETHSEPCQTSKMEIFEKIINCFQQLTIFAKSFILDV